MEPDALVLDLDGHGPRYGQVARALVTAIASGRLAPGAPLPSTRRLARDLGCARNIVLLAYEQLRLEGHVVGHRRAGTFVARPLAGRRPQMIPAAAAAADAGAEPRLSAAGRRLVDAAAAARSVTRRQPNCSIDFMFGLSEPDDRLVGRLRGALGQALRDRAFGYGPPAGDERLRDQIARRLRASRGISRPASQIVLTCGAQQGLDICARLLLDPGDEVVIEDPGYEAASAVFAAAGGRLIPVPVDDEGLDPASLPASESCRLAYVTPSHQFPTGAAMPIVRRQALVEWARRRSAYLIEDDYDGEFRYAGKPVAALAALAPESAIYCGTFAKSLFPACRLGYLVLPPALVEPAAHAKWLADRGGSRILERAVGELLATGEYDRHVRRLRRQYAERRRVLMRSLRARFGSAVTPGGSQSGLHLVAWLPALPAGRVDDLVAACRNRGVGVYSMARYCARPPDRAALLLGFGLVTPDQIRDGVARLFDAYREVLPRGRA